MGAGRLRVLACRGVAALGVAALAGACGGAPSSPLAVGQTPGRATPTVMPTAVPSLGTMSYGTFPATPDGLRALTVCEQWAALRGEYVTLIRTDTPYQLEQWFSGPQWAAAFVANSPLKTDPDYSAINAAFGVVSTASSASIGSARLLDKACAAAD